MTLPGSAGDPGGALAPGSAPLDIECGEDLVAYLRRTGRIEAGEQPTCVTLSGGISNRTVLVERPSGESWVLKQALERLRVPVEWFSDPQRVHREALGMRWLAELAPGAVPRFLFEDHRHHLVAMEAIPRPHENWKTLLLAGRLEEAHVEAFGRLLGTIHRNASLRRAELEVALAGRAFFEEMRVEPYYRYTAAQVPEAGEFLQRVVEEMDSRRLTLVHGDFSPKNILIAEGRFVLVDHEVVHVGDPAMDVGFAATHLLSKANHLPHLREEFTAAAGTFWRSYRRVLGDLDWAHTVEPFAVRQTLACLLARVEGRSRLEYLDADAAARQRAAACALIADTPARMEDLMEAFSSAL